MFQYPSVIPDSFYHQPPTLVPPKDPTPRHTLYLSNLDDQKFLRFTIKYLYLYKKRIPPGSLKNSLSAVLVHYYPLAGRLRVSEEDKEKLQVECTGEGALFSEAFVDMTAEEFLGVAGRPDKSWKKLLYYRGEGQGFLDAPLLSIQVTHLTCGGMILCTAINHCLADGIGTVHFLRDWAQLTAWPASHLPLAPISGRNLLRPRTTGQVYCPRIEFSGSGSIPGPSVDPFMKPMVPTSTLFSCSRILGLKRLCVPSLKCTSFEVLASHVWRTWVRSLDLPLHLRVKLLFSVNIRSRVQPNLPDGYYGNAFVLACAEASVQELAGQNLCHGVRLVQEAKGRVTNEYVWSVVDHLEKSRAWPDLTASLVISPWTRLGLEDLDFGQGRPVHMGPMSSEIYCLFLPVVNEPDATTVLMSVPADVVDKFEYLLNNFSIETSLDFGDNEEMLIDMQKSCLISERGIARERDGEEILEGRLF